MSIAAYKRIGELDRDVFGKAARHLLVVGVGSISPLLLTAIVFLLIDSPIVLNEFIENGEAGICAVTVLLGAGLLIARELTPPFQYRSAFFFVVMILWTMAILLYACVRVNDATTIGLNTSVLSWLSIIVWSLALALSVIVVAIDATREKIDFEAEVQRAKTEQYENLQSKFKEADDE